jgi:hypothetical protein
MTWRLNARPPKDARKLAKFLSPGTSNCVTDCGMPSSSEFCHLQALFSRRTRIQRRDIDFQKQRKNKSPLSRTGSGPKVVCVLRSVCCSLCLGRPYTSTWRERIWSPCNPPCMSTKSFSLGPQVVDHPSPLLSVHCVHIVTYTGPLCNILNKSALSNSHYVLSRLSRLSDHESRESALK